MSRNARSKKMIRWVLVGLASVIVVGVGGVFWQVNNVKRRLADFITAQPQATAVVTYTFDENGQMVDDDSAIFHNADEPLVVASVMKTAVLAAYADMVVNGELDPNEPVPVTAWERYYLPLSDGGAHVLGLQSQGLEADSQGFAVDQTAVVTLDDLAGMMMHFSGNAATDYLIERIGLARITAVTQNHLPNQTPIYYTLGYALAAFNHDAPFSFDRLKTVQANLAANDTSDIEPLIDLYLHDETWRLAQIEFMLDLSVSQMTSAAMWDYQSTAAYLLPRGTARDYAHMMAQIGSGNFISPEVSQMMQRKLETVPSDWPLRLLYFDRFGAKDGTTAGVLTMASYGIAKRGSQRGQTRVVVLFANGLPLERFGEQLQFQGHYLLPLDLAQVKGNFARLQGLRE